MIEGFDWRVEVGAFVGASAPRGGGLGVHVKSPNRVLFGRDGANGGTVSFIAWTPLSVTDVKVIPLHVGLNSASQDARDARAIPPHLQAPSENGRNEAVNGDAPPAAVPGDVSPAAAPSGHDQVRRRRRRLLKHPSPASVLARSLDTARKQQLDALQIFERVLNRPAPKAPVLEQPAADIPAPEAKPVADDAVFWQVWLEHRAYLRSHSLRFAGGNVADAEDALSEAMLKAAQSFSPTKIRNHRGWLLRLVHNACMDRHRSNSRQRRIAKDIMDGEAQSAPAVMIQPDRSPEDLLAALEQVDDLRRAMNALPAFLAEPLFLYLDERSDGEIAKSLNVTKEVVRKRRQIARALLRRQIYP